MPMNDGYFKAIAARFPTRMWVNNPTLAESQEAIEAGAWACTTNPTYAAKMLEKESDLGEAIIRDALSQTSDDHAAADLIQQKVVQRILPVFAGLSEGPADSKGLVSIQGNPYRDEDPEAIYAEAMEYRKLGPNVLSKIPATKAGLVAMEKVLRAGMPVIATEVMSIAQARQCAEVELRLRREMDSAPCFFITHITGIYDEYLAGAVEKAGIDVPPDLLEKAGWMVARKQEKMLRSMQSGAIMLGGGARQLRHFTDMVGGDMHVTINWSTAEELLASPPPVEDRFHQPLDAAEAKRLRAAVPDFRRAWDDDGLTVEEFEGFGPVQYFRDMFVAGWDKLLAALQQTRSKTK